VPKTKDIISKRDLDALIREKVAQLSVECAEVTPMPVVWRARGKSGCNWAVPGWTGDSAQVQRCVERLRKPLDQLRTAYDIPEEH